MLEEPAYGANIVKVVVAAWHGFADIADGIEADDAAVRLVLVTCSDLLQCVLEHMPL
jgi:hypothetical protein